MGPSACLERGQKQRSGLRGRNQHLAGDNATNLGVVSVPFVTSQLGVFVHTFWTFLKSGEFVVGLDRQVIVRKCC